jgi:hypothetical protein
MAGRGRLADPGQPGTKGRRSIIGLTEDRKDHEGDQRREFLGCWAQLTIDLSLGAFVGALGTSQKFAVQVKSLRFFKQPMFFSMDFIQML